MEQRKVYVECYRTRLDCEGVPVAGERIGVFPDALNNTAFHGFVRILRNAGERRAGKAITRETRDEGGATRAFTIEVPSASGNGEALAYTFKYFEDHRP